MLFRSSRRQARQEAIERVYGAIVAQARLPSFYMDYAVPDTVEGRFDLVVLHLHLVYRRLAEEDAGRETAQEVFDFFISDMDAVLREMGTGDLSVPKKMRGIGEAYYGRASAYDAALKDADNAALAAALRRNIFGEDGADNAALRLAHYARASIAALAGQKIDAIAGGRIEFPDPEQVCA